MNRLKADGSTGTFKSHSPRSDCKTPMFRSPRLPNINSTQKLSKKYFMDSPREPLEPPKEPQESLPKKTTIFELPQPIIEQKKPPSRHKFEENSDFSKKGDSQSVLENSISFHDNNDLFKLRLEIQQLKLQLQTTTKRLNVYQTTFKDCEKALKPDRVISLEFLADTREDDIQKIPEMIVAMKIELTKALESSKRKEATEKLALKEYKEEVVKLVSENASLKEFALETSRELDKLKQNKNMKHEAGVDRLQESLCKSEKLIEGLKEELVEKTLEYNSLKELLSRIETQKKRSADTIQTLETEVSKQRNEYLKLEFLFENNKTKTQEIYEQLVESQLKAKQCDSLLAQLESQSETLKSYELKQLEDELQLKSLTEHLHSLHTSFESQRNYWYKKEAAYQKSVQDLLTQVESERLNREVHLAETIKLKKALTLKDSDETIQNLSREEAQRYREKINMAEVEAANYMIETQKFKRNVEYYRELIKNKNVIISQLEMKISHIESKGKEIEQDFKDDEQRYKDVVARLRSSLMCQNCCNRQSVLMVSPCGHAICEKCKPSIECTVCSMPFLSCSSCGFLDSLDALNKEIEEIFSWN